jgi:hypothetical protein
MAMSASRRLPHRRATTPRIQARTPPKSRGKAPSRGKKRRLARRRLAAWQSAAFALRDGCAVNPRLRFAPCPPKLVVLMKALAARARCVWLVGWCLVVASAASGDEPLRARAVAERLDALRETIASELTAELQRTNPAASYTVVWRIYEDLVIAGLERILPRHVPGLTASHFDAGTGGREKNRLADFAIVLPDGTIEISIKAARKSANPENDMGTFRDHPRRKQLFAAAFTAWVRYDDANPRAIRCDRVFFDRTWRLVGRSTLVDGVKYRKKDGNMRPKPWAMFDSGESYWASEAEFEAAVKRAELHRANELIREYLNDLSESDQRLLYEKLREKFAAPN